MREVPFNLEIMIKADSVGVNNYRGHGIETPMREGVHHSSIGSHLYQFVYWCRHLWMIVAICCILTSLYHDTLFFLDIYDMIDACGSYMHVYLCEYGFYDVWIFVLFVFFRCYANVNVWNANDYVHDNNVNVLTCVVWRMNTIWDANIFGVSLYSIIWLWATWG